MPLPFPVALKPLFRSTLETIFQGFLDVQIKEHHQHISPPMLGSFIFTPSVESSRIFECDTTPKMRVLLSIPRHDAIHFLSFVLDGVVSISAVGDAVQRSELQFQQEAGNINEFRAEAGDRVWLELFVFIFFSLLEIPEVSRGSGEWSGQDEVVSALIARMHCAGRSVIQSMFELEAEKHANKLLPLSTGCSNNGSPRPKKESMDALLHWHDQSLIGRSSPRMRQFGQLSSSRSMSPANEARNQAQRALWVGRAVPLLEQVTQRLKQHREEATSYFQGVVEEAQGAVETLMEHSEEVVEKEFPRPHTAPIEDPAGVHVEHLMQNSPSSNQPLRLMESKMEKHVALLYTPRDNVTMYRNRWDRKRNEYVDQYSRTVKSAVTVHAQHQAKFEEEHDVAMEAVLAQPRRIQRSLQEMLQSHRDSLRATRRLTNKVQRATLSVRETEAGALQQWQLERNLPVDVSREVLHATALLEIDHSTQRKMELQRKIYESNVVQRIQHSNCIRATVSASPLPTTKKEEMERAITISTASSPVIPSASTMSGKDILIGDVEFDNIPCEVSSIISVHMQSDSFLRSESSVNKNVQRPRHVTGMIVGNPNAARSVVEASVRTIEEEKVLFPPRTVTVILAGHPTAPVATLLLPTTPPMKRNQNVDVFNELRSMPDVVKVSAVEPSKTTMQSMHPRSRSAMINCARSQVAVASYHAHNNHLNSQARAIFDASMTAGGSHYPDRNGASHLADVVKHNRSLRCKKFAAVVAEDARLEKLKFGKHWRVNRIGRKAENEVECSLYYHKGPLKTQLNKVQQKLHVTQKRCHDMLLSDGTFAPRPTNCKHLQSNRTQSAHPLFTTALVVNNNNSPSVLHQLLHPPGERDEVPPPTCSEIINKLALQLKY